MNTFEGNQQTNPQEKGETEKMDLKDKCREWWNKNRRWILPVAGVLGAIALAYACGKRLQGNDEGQAEEVEREEVNEKPTRPKFDPELFDLFPPGDENDRLPQRVLADSVGMSSRRFGDELRKLGLLYEDGGLTPEGEKYGALKFNRNGYPYIKWDRSVARMVGDPDAWSEYVHMNRKLAGLE